MAKKAPKNWEYDFRLDNSREEDEEVARLMDLTAGDEEYDRRKDEAMDGIQYLYGPKRRRSRA